MVRWDYAQVRSETGALYIYQVHIYALYMHYIYTRCGARQVVEARGYPRRLVRVGVGIRAWVRLRVRVGVGVRVTVRVRVRARVRVRVRRRRRPAPA